MTLVSLIADTKIFTLKYPRYNKVSEADIGKKLQDPASLTRKYLVFQCEDYCVIVTQVSFFSDTGVNLMQNAFDSPLTRM